MAPDLEPVVDEEVWRDPYPDPEVVLSTSIIPDLDPDVDDDV